MLIDSRTGVSDIAGICTIDMPDQLVACYTLNRQSIYGVAQILRRSGSGAGTGDCGSSRLRHGWTPASTRSC